MVLDRAMQALPLPEILPPSFHFLSHNLFRGVISNMVISAANPPESG